MPADPKPPRRIVDPQATARACLRYRACPCGAPSATGHHLVSRRQGGDDVVANIVPLCGSGTTGCHGLVENEDPATLRMVGRHLLEHRHDCVRYLGLDWIERRLGVAPSDRRPYAS